MAEYSAIIKSSVYNGSVVSGGGYNQALQDVIKDIESLSNNKADKTQTNLTAQAVQELRDTKADKTILESLDRKSLVMRGQVDDNVDLNSLTGTGVYFLYERKTYPNFPAVAVGQSGMLYVTESSYQCFQSLHVNDGRVFTRKAGYYPGNNWTDWYTTTAENIGAADNESFSQLKITVDDHESMLHTDIDLSDRFSNGLYINTGKSVGYQFNVSDLIPIANSSTSHAIIPVKSGERYNIIGGGGNASRLWALLDNNRVLRSVSNANVTVSESTGGLILTADADGYLIVNAWTSSAHSIKKLSAVKFETVDPDSKYVEVRVPFNAIINKLVRSNTGEVIDDSTRGSNCTTIDCESAAYIKAVTTVYNGEYGCAFYDSNDAFMYGIKTVAEGEKKFVVPSGAKYFRMCWGRNAITQDIHVFKPVTTLLRDIYEILSGASASTMTVDEGGEV